LGCIFPVLGHAVLKEHAGGQSHRERNMLKSQGIEAFPESVRRSGCSFALVAAR